MACLTNHSQYVAECAPPEVRGLLIALQQFAIEFGILISFWINYGLFYLLTQDREAAN